MPFLGFNFVLDLFLFLFSYFSLRFMFSFLFRCLFLLLSGPPSDSFISLLLFFFIFISCVFSMIITFCQSIFLFKSFFSQSVFNNLNSWVLLFSFFIHFSFFTISFFYFFQEAMWFWLLEAILFTLFYCFIYFYTSSQAFNEFVWDLSPNLAYFLFTFIFVLSTIYFFMPESPLLAIESGDDDSLSYVVNRSRHADKKVWLVPTATDSLAISDAVPIFHNLSEGTFEPLSPPSPSPYLSSSNHYIVFTDGYISSVHLNAGHIAILYPSPAPTLVCNTFNLGNNLPINLLFPLGEAEPTPSSFYSHSSTLHVTAIPFSTAVPFKHFDVSSFLSCLKPAFMVPPMEVSWPICYSSFSTDLSQCSVLKQAYSAWGDSNQIYYNHLLTNLVFSKDPSFFSASWVNPIPVLTSDLPLDGANVLFPHQFTDKHIFVCSCCLTDEGWFPSRSDILANVSHL